MSKAKLTASEWELVKDAPYWVNQALAEADGRVAFLTRRRENKALEKAVEDYKTGNSLIKDIIADDSDAAKSVGKASQADAEKALNQIASIVEGKLGADDLNALKDFLLKVGNSVAAAAKERGVGTAAVSEKEADALRRIESALKVSAAYTTAHTVAKPKPAAKPSAAAKPAPAPAKREDEAKAEAAKKEAEAKKKKEAEERLAKARKEAEERQREAAAEREAKAKAEAEAKAAKEAEAARKEAEAKAAAAPKYTQFIAEHTVQPGDNLSFISERYYGHQANFRIIYEANKDVIGDNMNLIKPGQVLKIPKL